MTVLSPNTFPLPIGVSASFSNVTSGAGNTATFKWGEGGIYMITFQPYDPNNPGTITLTQVSGVTVDTNAIPVLRGGGAFTLQLAPGPSSWYFAYTNGFARVSMTQMQAMI